MSDLKEGKVSVGGDRSQEGQSYVVYGRSLVRAIIAPATSAAGVSGDGYQDIIIGAPYANDDLSGPTTPTTSAPPSPIPPLQANRDELSRSGASFFARQSFLEEMSGPVTQNAEAEHSSEKAEPALTMGQK
ncbi:MAG: hypothetical protein K0R48_335 [Gammaproteobacteria bacterium]|jgi:hypothetical protein|nr:hypothetical protein [Gammaproteobacteria bacterium]